MEISPFLGGGGGKKVAKERLFVHPELSAKVTGNTINPDESDRHKAIIYEFVISAERSNLVRGNWNQAND